MRKNIRNFEQTYAPENKKTQRGTYCHFTGEIDHLLREKKRLPIQTSMDNNDHPW